MSVEVRIIARPRAGDALAFFRAIAGRVGAIRGDAVGRRVIDHAAAKALG